MSLQPNLVSHPQSLGDCLTAGFTAFRRQWKPLFVIGFLFMTVVQLGQLWALARLSGMFPQLADGQPSDLSSVDPLHVAQYAVAFVGMIAIFFIGGVFYTGATLHLSMYGLRGEPTTWREALSDALHRFWTVLGSFTFLYLVPYLLLVIFAAVVAAIVMLLTQLAGTMAGVIVAIVAVFFGLFLLLVLVARMFFIAEAAFVDDLPFSKALSRSWDIMGHDKGPWTQRPLWRFSLYYPMIAAVFLAGYGLMLVPMSVMGLAFGESPNPFDPFAAFPLWARFLSGIWTGTTVAILTGITKAASLAFYFDLRARSQGGDLLDRANRFSQNGFDAPMQP